MLEVGKVIQGRRARVSVVAGTHPTSRQPLSSSSSLDLGIEKQAHVLALLQPLVQAHVDDLAAERGGRLEPGRGRPHDGGGVGVDDHVVLVVPV
jgi:hypothetical protein